MWGALIASATAHAENVVAVRGHYFRESSTRVVQPVVQISKDLPSGVDVTAHYLLDAITSASAASGPAGDNVFTEYRNETGLGVGLTAGRARVGLGYRYSAESDYWSHTGVASLALRLWQDTATLALSAGAGLDAVGRRVPLNATANECLPGGAHTCPLRLIFGGIGYTQVLSPVAVAQIGYEFADLEGYQASPYRQVVGAPERVPRHRFRNAVAARLAYYIPNAGLGFQLHYRYYWDWYRLSGPLDALPGFAGAGGDPWRITSHTIEGRVYVDLTRDLEARLTARYYPQGAANFWCDQQLPGCDPGRQLYAASDPKLGPVHTTLSEAKIYWDAVRWRDVPFFGWFSEGTFELSYGYLWQDTMFGGAHLLQAGYLIRY